jgi:hypothetical protein
MRCTSEEHTELQAQIPARRAAQIRERILVGLAGLAVLAVGILWL